MEQTYIRPVTPGDIGEIALLEGRCFVEPWSPLVFEQFAQAPGFLVAIDRSESSEGATGAPDGSLSGYVVTTQSSYKPDVAHVRNLAVHPERRRQGLGSQLLTASVSHYRENEFESVRLEVRASNTGAIELYRNHGFSVVGRQPGYYDNGEAAVVMSRPLSPSD